MFCVPFIASLTLKYLERSQKYQKNNNSHLKIAKLVIFPKFLFAKNSHFQFPENHSWNFDSELLTDINKWWKFQGNWEKWQAFVESGWSDQYLFIRSHNHCGFYSIDFQEIPLKFFMHAWEIFLSFSFVTNEAEQVDFRRLQLWRNYFSFCLGVLKYPP